MIVYVPYWDGAYWQGCVWGNATYAMRTSQDPATMANALRSAIRELDAELPLANIITMQEIVSESVKSRRFQTLLAGVFAGASLLLACLGIYGVISYSVTRRTNEIGIRIALGAQASQVLTLVLRQGIRPVFAGLLVGVAAALAAGKWVGSFLFGTQARRPRRDLGRGGGPAGGRSSGVLGSFAESVADRSYDCIAKRVACDAATRIQSPRGRNSRRTQGRRKPHGSGREAGVQPQQTRGILKVLPE